MAGSWKKLPVHVLLLLTACRHISTKSPDQTSPPQVTITPSPEVKSFVVKGGGHTERVELFQPVNLTLECIWTGNPTKPGNVTGHWREDGQEIRDSRVTVQPEKGQYSLKRVFNIAGQENLGNYSCMFGSEAGIEFILAVPQMGEVRDKPIVSYMGDSVVILCKMEETKPKPIHWSWYKEYNTEKEQIVPSTGPRRYEIENEKWKTRLVVHNLTEADSCLYYCSANYSIGTTVGHVELKVISFYDPLKPFAIIVVEVIVLVAAILLYEKSRSKKPPAADNGGISEQTNTLTQGESNGAEGSSSMRQRKV